MGTGKVYLVGAGPGDPKLLTMRGQELLCQADLVVYDHLVSMRLLHSCPPRAKIIYVGKEPERRQVSQRSINALLIRAAKAGKTVVRLKGGDPFLFGRGAEEALQLRQAGVSYEVVPGVSSALAVPAYAGIPLTHRTLASSVAIVTGHEDPTKPARAVRWPRLATACDTLVCLMGVKTLPLIIEQVIRHGRRPSSPCAVIEWGSTPAQRTVTGTLRTMVRQATQASIRPPAILIVGDVVTLRKTLRWFETRPLFGKRILVTRASDRAALLVEQLEALGALVEQLPAIELVPVPSNRLFREAIRELPNTDWVFFTSPEGNDWFSRMLRPYRKDVRWLLGCHIGAIGSKTAVAIEERGLHVDFIPRQFSQEGMLKDFPRRLLDGKRGLIFSAAESRDVLETGLRQRGMQVRRVPIYRTALPKSLLARAQQVIQQPFDFVTVTSASCVDHLVQALQGCGHRQRFRQWRIASIGPVTSAAVRAHGGRVVVEAASSTIEGLVEALCGAPRALPEGQNPERAHGQPVPSPVEGRPWRKSKGRKARE
ncbi:MAG: uroporphyrinogen-III C-methyltransferase [Candidatus Omnitrophica bacterium]|nr:uroporphyrinogen-III C-methyltransferase [Candidatus Omnitrophota bacterium]